MNIAKYSNMAFLNPDGSRTSYNCEIYFNENNQPYAAKIAAVPSSQTGISAQLISNLANGIAQSCRMQSGSLHIFVEKSNERFDQVPFEVQMHHSIVRAVPNLKKNSAEYEQKQI